MLQYGQFSSVFAYTGFVQKSMQYGLGQFVAWWEYEGM